MKLAEALILRADIKKRIEQLRLRLLRNAKVQEGQKPGEDPEALTQEFERLSQEMLDLIQRINKTNSATHMADGGTLADAVALRDVLTMKHNLYRELAQAATITADVRTRSEVKFKSTVRVAQTQKLADKYAQTHRELDTKIQEMNWDTELLE